ncbi:hypothetical protein [Tateyamaria sp.]|uniref:hypothetical protein n=1 Tax=Tateyamaria sp. TaxID=1929288 RepID=UPI0032A0A2D5
MAVDPSLSSLKFDKSDREETLFYGSHWHYPTQTDAAANTDYAGEYRGFYIARNGKHIWHPRLSELGGRSGGGHNGVDIYTAYANFPLETPIRAVTDGYFEPFYDAGAPNDMGDRAAINAKLGSDTIVFRYGHFSRFYGPARDVKKGELIGFAGCSGNADTYGECSTIGGCKVTSCHIHLSAWANTIGKKTILNAADLLRWTVDFKAPDPAKATSVLCKNWKDKREEVAAIPRTEGVLVKKDALKWKRRTKWSRKPLFYPFDQVFFDDTKKLNAARRCYRMLLTRLASTDTAHRKGQDPQLKVTMREMMRDRWIGAAAGIETIIDEAFVDLEALYRPASADLLAGPAVRSLIKLRHAAWLLTGGGAINAGISNRALVEACNLEKKKNKKMVERSFREKSKHSSVKALRKKFDQTSSAPLPFCGVSMGGEAHMVAAEYAVAVHHRSTRMLTEETTPGKTTTETHRVTTFDFGVGSNMCGIWSSDVLSYETPPPPSPGDASETAQHRFLREVDYALSTLWTAAGTLHTNQQALNWRKDQELDAREKAAKAVLSDLVSAAIYIKFAGNFLNVDMLAGDAAKAARRAEIEALLGKVIRTNQRLYDEAYLASKQPETTTTRGPSLQTLRVVGLPTTEGAGG